MFEWFKSFWNKLFGGNDSQDDTPQPEPEPVPNPEGPFRRVLCVGIDKYGGLDGIDLAGCVNDAILMEGILSENYVPKGQTRLLLNERATHEGLKEALKWLMDRYNVVVQVQCDSGGTGRRGGPKPRCLWRVGSTPTCHTIL